MLKFATKKPPRLKQGEVETEFRGHGFVRGQGQYGGSVCAHDSLDSGGIRTDDSFGYVQSSDSGFHENKENLGYNTYGRGVTEKPFVNWKAYNVKYGKIGLQNEIQAPGERQVGKSRNENVNVGQKSHVNPGFSSETLENRGQSDINRNMFPSSAPGSGSPSYPKGSGYQYAFPRDQGQRSSAHVVNGSRHYQLINGHVNNREQPFPAPSSLSTDSNGNYGNPYSLDSTTSMSIDSMSTSGDRSSKSVSETQDYDMIMDVANMNHHRMDMKPPSVPHKHRHVHVGRGTHGVCEGPTSPTRPGSSDTTMTSSLRKSPSFRTGHHVRWGPGVVNSGHQLGEAQQDQKKGPPAKKTKKKVSLRSLLNLPKFPVSDEDLTDYSSDSGQSPRLQNGPAKGPLFSESRKVPLESKQGQQTELACLRYKTEFPVSGKGSSAVVDSAKQPAKANLPKLNITSANQYGYYSEYPYLHHQDGVGCLVQDNEVSTETGAISYPIVHSGISQSGAQQQRGLGPVTSARSPVNSVRPFLINGQSSELLDYDNTPSSMLPGVHVKPGVMNEASVHPTSASSKYLQAVVEPSVGVSNEGKGFPVSFDTFVTLGRPTEASVTFDTFVTHGRPYATSTPVPNGNLGYAKHVGVDYSTGVQQLSAGGESVSAGSRGLTTNVTYWAGTQLSPPLVQHSVTRNQQVPVMSGPRSHDSHVTMGTPKFPTADSDIIQRDSALVQESSARGSQFKDSCTYRQKEMPDYDDDVFCDLAKQLLPEVVDSSKKVRRKLDFESSQSVVTSCVSQPHQDYTQDALNHNYTGYPKVQAVPGVSQQRGNMSNLNEMMTRSVDHTDGGDHLATILDLVYITERIISMSFASEEHDTTYKYNLKEVTRMLKTKHQDNYLVINISDKRADLAKHCPQVLDYGWPDNLAPPLERLCSICKAIDSWLGSDINHVVVVHCKGGRGRIAVVIAAYMRYSNICASADQALDRFAMKRFYDDKLGGLPQPSQRRYVHYFAGLLSGAIQINSSALYLHHILIHGVPNFDTKGGCRPFIKVYQGMHPIFTSGVYNVTDNMQKVCISISPGIPLRGDILIKCYHKKNKAGQREIMWACQFHTCAISHNSLVFSKNELDDAITDPRFPDTGKVEFVFGNNSEGLVQVADFKSDVTVPVDDTTDALTRWDSYENFGKSSKDTDVNANGLSSSEGVDSFRVTQLGHSQGPVDGSLYAQVNKRKLETQIIQQNGKLQNGGSFNSSLDSGISAFSVPMGTATTQKTSSSESWAYNTRGEYHQPTISYGSKSYSTSSPSPRSGKVSLDEQSQLDQILSDLLNDQAYVSPKSPSGKTKVSSETRTFKTVEDHISPEGNIVVQRGEVNYKIPEVEKHITVKTVKEEKSYKPVNAFTYTPSSPEMSRSFEPIKSPTSPKTTSLPYRTDYENNFSKKESYSYQQNGPSSLSDGEQSLSWLQQQQAKLREKSIERDPKRAQNEQMMIEELKTAQTQNKYFQKKSQSEEQQSSSKASTLSNGPASPYSYTVSRTHTYNTDKSPSDTSFPSHDSLPMAHSHTTYITEQSTSKVSNKPPPSPSLQRSVASSQSSAPPVPPPARTSSRDYMQQQQQTRNRSYSGGSYQQSSSSSAWKTETHTQPRTVQRHYSESAYDRDHYEKQHVPRTHTTPPISPRSVSPQTYQTYKTVYKTIHHRGEDEADFSAPQPIEVQIEKQIQEKQQTVQQQKQTEAQKPHYITEVIVQRTGGAEKSREQDKKDTDNRLDALEKTLQAASQSIMATSPWQQQQNIMKQEETRRFETRSYETKTERREERQERQQSIQTQNEPLVPPKKIEVTEEDRITLKPIGPGVHQLEPEGSTSGSHSGTLGRDSTLGRSTTPSFPISPGVSAGGGHVISPTGTMQSHSMQYQTREVQQQNQQFDRSTLPHSSQGYQPSSQGYQPSSQGYQMSTLPHSGAAQNMQVSQGYSAQTLPHQSSYQQQQQQQQQYQQKQSYSSSSSSQQYHTQQYSSSGQDGSLHVETNPRLLMSQQQARSPSSPGSPPSPGNLNTLRQQLHIAHNMSNSAVSPGPHSATGQSSPSVYFGLSRRGSLTSLADSEAVHSTPRFVKDTSKYWYKPNISREEAILMLKDKMPGTFVVRDSNSFPGAFGLALKVATLPPNVQTKSTGDPMADLVRHFLIEPTSKGVRLRGCSNEPVFGSLASLVYQHSLTPLALPCKLMLPEQDPAGMVTEMSPTTEMPSSATALLAQGAACNVVFLNTVDTESLTGPQAVARACKLTFDTPPPKITVVHFKVSNQGITLTDNQRKLFFRRHYPVAAVTYCGMDPEDRKWRRETDVHGVFADAKVFGFVARKQGSASDNACHLFAELDPDQPASAIVNFVTKIMIGQGKIKS